MAHTPTRPFSLIKAFCERPEVDAIFKNARKFSASSRKCIEKPVSALRLKALRPPVYYVCCLLLCRPHRHKVLWSGLSPKARKKLKKTLNRQKYVELRTKKAHGHYSTKGATLVAVNGFPPGYGTLRLAWPRRASSRLLLGPLPRRAAVTRALPAKPQSGIVHTAGGVMGVGSTRSRIADPQGKRPPTVSPMTGTKSRHRRTNSTRQA